MGPIWGLQDPGGPNVGPMNFVIWVRSHPISRMRPHRAFLKLVFLNSMCLLFFANILNSKPWVYILEAKKTQTNKKTTQMCGLLSIYIHLNHRNPPLTCGFPSPRANNAWSASIPWCHHKICLNTIIKFHKTNVQCDKDGYKGGWYIFQKKIVWAWQFSPGVFRAYHGNNIIFIRA